MKRLFFLLFSCLVVFSTYCQDHEAIQRFVLQAEKQWNAGNPDKSFLSAGNSIEYGLGYLKKNKYTESLWYFEEVVKKDGNNAFAQLFAGLAYIGLQQFEAAESSFTKLANLHITVQEGARALLSNARKEAESSNATKTPSAPKPPVNQANTGGKKPVKIEPVKESETVERKGGSLVYGDYVFTLDYWDVSQRRMVHQQKGYFTLYANGTYRYMGTTGKYSYNPATGSITWLSGTFRNMGKNTTTFQRNKTTCEIDFEYQTNSGSVYYSGGKNL